MSSSATVTSGCLNLKKFKGTTKASACNFYISITEKKNSEKTVKNSEHNGQLSVLTKPIYSTQQANDTNPKKEKTGRPFLEKKTLQKTFFTSVLTIAREMAKP